MSKREHRPKASEVFAKANLVFGTKVGFAEAFPEIKALKVTVMETGHVGYGGKRTHSYTEVSVGEYIDCSNPLCYNGGTSLGSHLREMVHERKEEGEFTDICRGNEASAKGRRVYRKCVNLFRSTISIEYHGETPRPEPEEG